VVRDFTVIMIWGVIVGTYSTVYVATPVLYYLNIRAVKPAAETVPAPTARPSAS
jgi:preprotein translocase subunit SecF